MAVGTPAQIKDFIKIWSDSVFFSNFQLKIEKELVAHVMRVKLNNLGKKL